MNSKFSKVLIFILEIAVAAIAIYFCVLGFLISRNNLEQNIQFIECAFRCILVVIFAFFYYFAFSRSFGSSGFFMPLYLLFNLISELKIVEKYSQFSYSIVIPPDVLICLFIFSNYMMAASLIGYGVFYDIQTQKPSQQYFLVSSALCVLLFYSIPKPLTITNMWNSPIACLVSISFFILCATVFIILLAVEARGPNTIRSLAAIMLISSNYINLFYDTFIMNIVGTLFFGIGILTIIIVSKINDITL